MPGRLEGRVSFITGAGSGIGEAGAKLFAREGATVVVAVADAVAERVDATVAAIREQGGRAIGRTVDVADRPAVFEAVHATVDELGALDVLWNNAGIGRGAGTPLEDIRPEDWELVLSVNLTGVFSAMQAAIPHMKRRRTGSILTTSSVSGIKAFVPGGAPYTATKGAVIALTKLAALELAPFNIRVNCIAPGRVRTNMGEGIELPPDDPFGMRQWKPPRPTPVTDATRDAEPEEIAHTALFLVSGEVGPMTGTVIAHDGGVTSR